MMNPSNILILHEVMSFTPQKMKWFANVMCRRMPKRSTWPALGLQIWHAADDGDQKKLSALLKGLKGLEDRADQAAEALNYQDGEWANTPFFRAVLGEHIGCARLLLAHPLVDPGLPNRLGESPFFVACETGSMDLIILLCGHPLVDINRTDNDGASPLWIAASENQEAVVAYLLAWCGVGTLEVEAATHRRRSESWSGTTPYQWALRAGHESVASLLHQYLLNPSPTRARLRRLLGLTRFDVAGLFAAAVLLCDGYFKITLHREGDDDHLSLQHNTLAGRFFGITSRLPMELQMRLCMLCYQIDGRFVRSQDLETVLPRLLGVLGPGS